ncbi:MAG: hypothetical protein ABIS50_10450 [Luteolibacter sp.]|uniref:hypothetical protein n=1 Tax=Luteolibacter sp. TaxID=1962973 RepID=UPI003265AFB0
MSEIRFTAPTSRGTSDFRALLLQEWKLCRNQFIRLASVWFIGLWVLVIFQHPGWLLAIGVAHIMTLSAVQGGRDVIDGTEEFSFTLPPGRGPLFLARIFPGFVFLAANGLLGSLAILYSLPQRLWSLVFSSGLTESFSVVREPVWYIAALFAPCAAHAITFTTAALSGSRQGVNAAVSVGLIGTAATMLVGWWADKGLSPEPWGILTGVGLLGVAVLVPAAGYLLYLRKETSASSDSADGVKVRFWIVAAIVTAFFLLLAFWLRSASVSSVGMNDLRRDQMVAQNPAHFTLTPVKSPAL